MRKKHVFGPLLALLLAILACRPFGTSPAAPATEVSSTPAITATSSETATQTALSLPSLTPEPTMLPLSCEKEALQQALDEVILVASGLKGHLTPPAVPALQVVVVYASPRVVKTVTLCEAILTVNGAVKGSQWDSGWLPPIRKIFTSLASDGRKAIVSYGHSAECTQQNATSGCRFWEQEQWPMDTELQALAVNVVAGIEEKTFMLYPAPTATPVKPADFDKTLCTIPAIQEALDKAVGVDKFTVTTAMPLETGCQISATTVNAIEKSEWDQTGMNQKIRGIIPGGALKFYYILGAQDDWHGNTLWQVEKQKLIGFVANCPSHELSKLYITRRAILMLTPASTPTLLSTANTATPTP